MHPRRVLRPCRVFPGYFRMRLSVSAGEGVYSLWEMDYVLKGFQLSFVWDLRIQLVLNISFPKQDYMYVSTDGKFWIVTGASLRILEI